MSFKPTLNVPHAQSLFTEQCAVYFPPVLRCVPQVYNLTPFLHYHPGGVPEIMKGAGRDCTALFNKYHPWVNFDTLVGVSDSMPAKCLLQPVLQGARTYDSGSEREVPLAGGCVCLVRTLGFTINIIPWEFVV